MKRNETNQLFRSDRHINKTNSSQKFDFHAEFLFSFPHRNHGCRSCLSGAWCTGEQNEWTSSLRTVFAHPETEALIESHQRASREEIRAYAKIFDSDS